MPSAPGPWCPWGGRASEKASYVKVEPQTPAVEARTAPRRRRHPVNDTYALKHPEFGWQAFGGNVKTDGEWVSVQILDAFRQRVYVAPRGLWLTLDSGTFESVEINTRSGVVRLGLSRASSPAPIARLRVEQPAAVAGVGAYRLKDSVRKERAAFVITLQNRLSWVELTEAGQ